MTSTPLPECWTELAQRSADGIQVSLLWNRSDSGLAVVVADSRSGETFLLRAAETNALDVFYHPYAYAAAEGPLYLASEDDVLAYTAA